MCTESAHLIGIEIVLSVLRILYFWIIETNFELTQALNS